MAKTIIREIIITLLLCLAIILILSVLLYGYVPTNKVMPEKVSYTTPESLKEELNKNDGVNESEVILTYEVDPTDLDNYKKIKDYKPGKPNPFSSYEKEENTAAANTTTNNASAGTSSTAGNNTANSNSGNKENQSNTAYFQNKGLK